MQAQPKLLEVVRRVIPNGPRRSDPERISAAPFGHAFAVTRDVPAAGLRTGDVLFHTLRPERRFRGVRGAAIRLPRAALGCIIAEPDAFAFVEDSWPGASFGTFTERDRRPQRDLYRQEAYILTMLGEYDRAVDLLKLDAALHPDADYDSH